MLIRTLPAAIRLCLGLTVLFSINSAAFAQQALQDTPAVASTPQPGVDFVAGEVLVKFRDVSAKPEALDSLSELGAKPERSVFEETEVWQVAEGRELELVDELNSLPGVEYAEPNYIYQAESIPNDPEYSKQWGHQQTQAEAAWDITTGEPVVVAVLDSGVDTGHPELSAKIVPGIDYVDGDSNPSDMNGHGTHVTGIIAAQGNNGIGVAGVSWGARIMPVRVLDHEGRGSTDSVIAGIRWAYLNGARVINLSLSGQFYSQSIQDEISAAYAAGVVVVSAMGNDPDGIARYPAAMDHVVGVGATNRYNTRANYSNYGMHIDVVAPGGEMFELHDPDGYYSTLPTYPVNVTALGFALNYDYLSGTSMATPYVSGLAALILGLIPGLTPDQVLEIMQATTDDLGQAGFDVYYGYGRVNVWKAVQKVTPVLSSISNPEHDGDYLIDWSDVFAFASYRLQEDDSPSFTSPLATQDVSVSQLQITGHKPGVYYYRVAIMINGVPTRWSNIISVGVVPSVPALANISNGDQADSYLIEWAPVEGARGYQLVEADNSNFTNATVRYQGKAVKYQVTGQVGGKTWHYRVRAYNLAGNGAWSALQSTAVKPNPVAAPGFAQSVIKNTNLNGKYLLAWTAVAKATSYILEGSRDPYFSSPEYTQQVKATQIEIKGRADLRYFRVRAVTLEGSSPWSGSASIQSWIFLSNLKR